MLDNPTFFEIIRLAVYGILAGVGVIGLLFLYFHYLGKLIDRIPD